MDIKDILEDEKQNSGRIRLYLLDADTLTAYGHSAHYLNELMGLPLIEKQCPVSRQIYPQITFDINLISDLPEYLILNISDDIIELVRNNYAPAPII